MTGIKTGAIVMGMAYLFLLGALLLNASANILLKLASSNKVSLINWQLVLGLLFFALNAGFYFLALRMLPLSLAYPIMVALSFIIINSFAYFFLSETITTFQLVGYLCIVIGISLVVFYQATT